jgi:hypothetical protein
MRPSSGRLLFLFDRLKSASPEPAPFLSFLFSSHRTTGSGPGADRQVLCAPMREADILLAPADTRDFPTCAGSL